MQVAAFLRFGDFESVFGREEFHALRCAAQEELVAFAESRFRERELFHALHGTAASLRGAAYFKHGDAVTAVHVEFAQRFPRKRRPRLDDEARQSLRELILFRQLNGRFPRRLRRRLTIAFQEAACERQEYEYARDDAQYADGREREEPQRRVTGLHQRIAHDEVGRCADEREHSAHAARKGERHQKARLREPCGAAQAHHDGEHQRHGARVAHKCPDQRGGEHHEHKEPRLVAAGQSHYLMSYAPRQSRTENAFSHDEQACHHDDNGIGEARQCFLGRQDAAKHERECRTHGDEVRANAAVDKQNGRETKDNNRDGHVSNKIKGIRYAKLSNKILLLG